MAVGSVNKYMIYLIHDIYDIELKTTNELKNIK